jgi:hypothetical protein
MRGQRDKQAAETAQDEGQAVEVIDVSAHKPRRIPSAKWRELIKKVWEADPLLCPICRREMRIVALIDDCEVIERILRHLGLLGRRSSKSEGGRDHGVRVTPSTGPPPQTVIELWLDDPFPACPTKPWRSRDYDTEPVTIHANG